MGILLSLLKPDAQVSTDVFVDFESNRKKASWSIEAFAIDAKPTPEEEEIFTADTTKLKEAKLLVVKLRCYTGCGDQIRKVIMTN
jgi:hypothetical protein